MATQQQRGGAGSAKRKPVFTRVDQLIPGTNGHTLTAKVLTSNTVGRAVPAAQLRSAPPESTIDLMKPGATIILRNAKIDIFKGSMKLAVDKWGRIEVTEPANFTVKEDNNLSLIEYELVNVVEE
ncbi:hypothetical protein Cni_G23315 [Canna indica]|uniref:Single-stranded DNA binding protein Ssb-like OB fold domain-containing protein n=1 Tax=Canna indica TaxID=4628 RepID=A0AAQ3QNG7_9LILI|nr:hypothetical protein Cni_G23315 [Canna indica]